MGTVEVLKRARELLSDPKRWTKGAIARDSEGLDVSSWHAEACRWCTAGAINKVSKVNRIAAHNAIARAIGIGRSGVLSIGEWNDSPRRTHAEVLAAFDKAIAIASQEST